MGDKSVCQMAARYEELTSDTGKPKKSKDTIFSKCYTNLITHQFQDNATKTDDLTPKKIMALRVGELSSSDDTDSEDDLYYRDTQVLNSVASAIQKEFLRKIPSKRKNFAASVNRLRTSAFSVLLTNQTSLDVSDACIEAAPNHNNLLQEDNSGYVIEEEEENACIFSSSKSPVYETIKEVTEVGKTQVPAQTTDCLHDVQSDLASSSKSSHQFPELFTPSDLPRNALILFVGGRKMTAAELRQLDLSRPLQDLLSSQNQSFTLLRILEDSFVLEDCGVVGEEKHQTTDEVSVVSQPRQKSYKDNPKKQEKQALFPKEEKRSPKKSLLSCMKFCGPSKYPQLLQHKNSLCLKSYENLRRKRKCMKFLYKRVIFCGAEICGMPESWLTWVYHLVKSNVSAVECYAVECDDLQHARLLARALGNQIATFNGNKR
ncbi:uncharacterized protein LOC143448939 isoform X1 [Clavelina lepadiformis]|uniref:uncharacterized protein LOC143448939 isoform X1 n=2 Tax=Clavelina lepadiformis TaxID=159417 RepID=UPI0040432FB1